MQRSEWPATLKACKRLRHILQISCFMQKVASQHQCQTTVKQIYCRGLEDGQMPSLIVVYQGCSPYPKYKGCKIVT